MDHAGRISRAAREPAVVARTEGSQELRGRARPLLLLSRRDADTFVHEVPVDKYPQAAYPYNDLVAINRGRGKHEAEYELLDTGVFDDNRYFDVFG